MMRSVIVVFLLAMSAVHSLAQSSSPVADREWYAGLKRTAKYVRVAIVTQRAMSKADVETFSRDARSAMSGAETLSLPEKQKSICRDAASAVVSVVDGATYGSSLGDTTTISEHFARWERLGDQCLAAINGR